ncbi:matrix metalloproteinase-21-like isoform X1 [Branchiostoma floridae x Branchiostoma japonicum]
MNVFRITRLTPPRPNFTTTVACLLRHVYAFVTLLLLVSEADRVPGGRGSGVGHAVLGAERVNIPAIVTERDAASFLERLGYFQPVDWESTLDRSRQTIFEPEDVAPDIFSDFDPSVMVEEVEGMGRDGEPTIGVDDEEFKEAIRKFQQANNLTITGLLDDATRNKMNEPRCGNPDHTLAKNGTKTVPPAPSNMTSNSSADTDAKSNATVVVQKRSAEDASQGNSRKRQSVLKTWMERQEERRKKRGIFVNNYVTWRLLGEGYSSQLDADLQLAVIQQAFRMWSEVIPPLFRPDHVSHIEEVDVNLAFGRDVHHSAWGGSTAVRHLGCPNEFQEQEYAHAFDEAAEVHINDQIQPYTVNRPDGISLLKVAVHEIGHILGLGHHEWANSVMQPNYAPQPYNFEIGAEDRRAVQELGYGKCEERFDTVFDWVRPNRDENGYMTGVIYNTFFFADGRYWMYENSKGRTRYGDPLLIRGGWQGIASRQIDGILHVWSRTWDVLFFFAGDSYWEYDSEREQIYTHDANGNPFPNLISYGFPGIPDNIDTVYYNRSAGYTYFFKDHLVYQYEVERQRVSPGFPKEIAEVFPGVPNNLDAAYYSYTHQTTFFLKGFDYWSISISTGAIDGPFTVNELWQDICKVWMWELDGS